MNQPVLPRAPTGNKVLLVDDDKDLLSTRKLRLQVEGYDVMEVNDSALVVDAMDAFKPDLVILDLIMPRISGEALLERIRTDARFQPVKIIVNSVKNFESDYRFCLESGADAYLAKPVEHDALSETIRRLLQEEVTVRFWGTRGSIPRPGRDTLRFGGNTPCVSVELSRDRFFIFDAGTGIVELGRTLATNRHYKFNLFISHHHWDHIQGLPFFGPLYRQANEMVIHGTGHGKLSLREVISGQMNDLYFPVTIKEYASRVYFVDLVEGDYQIEKLRVSTIGLNHPGPTLGYRVTSDTGKTVAYVTDHEIHPGGDVHNRNRLVAFLKDVDVLIHDATYFDEEYPRPRRMGAFEPVRSPEPGRGGARQESVPVSSRPRARRRRGGKKRADRQAFPRRARVRHSLLRGERGQRRHVVRNREQRMRGLGAPGSRRD